MVRAPNEDISDARIYLAASIKKFSSEHPGQVSSHPPLSNFSPLPQLQPMMQVSEEIYKHLVSYLHAGNIPEPLLH